MKRNGLLLLPFLVIVLCALSCEQTVNGISRDDVTGAWRANGTYMALNPDGTGECGDYSVNWNLKFRLEGHVIEGCFIDERTGESSTFRYKVDSVATYYRGGKGYRKLHVTVLYENGYGESEEWKELTELERNIVF